MAWLVRDDYQKWLIRVQGQEPKVFYRAFVNSRLVIVNVVLGDSTSPVCALIRSLKDSCARFLPEIVNLDHLSDTDKALVGEALRAVVHGPFFPEWEFHT